MEIKPTGNSLENINKTNVQNFAKNNSKAFSDVLNAATQKKSSTTVPVIDKPFEYIVQKGDNIWNIGKIIFKVDPRQIARDNGLSNPNLIKIGQKLIINPTASPTIQPRASEKVTATWYGAEHHNKITASGQRFNMYQNTLAHKTLPMGTKVRLVNPNNGKVAEGIVNDRGPYLKGRDVDVSYAMAKQLGFLQKGVERLVMEKI
ncbi:MAG: septal ring lytic transglycosylase RlpA family protein [Syntrophaceae bacterium]|nr:septal ring lytic transglycosylase RlpA family protein [Syntrophaceae bacterium]